MSPTNETVPVNRLIRSLLFVPATSTHLHQKAAASDADGVILDLEDAVPVTHKDQARQQAIEAANGLDWGHKSLVVRINGVRAPWCHKDVIAVAEQCPRVDLLLQPMVQGPDDLHFVATLLDQVQAATGAGKRIGLMGLVETPVGLEHIHAIAAAHGRLEALTFGAGDYAALMGMPRGVVGASDPSYAVRARDTGKPYPNDKWHWPLMRLANACRAHGLLPLDTVHGDLKDPAAFRSSARRAAALGYEGKLCIHPGQVPIANEVFSPAEETVSWARELLRQIEEAQSEGRAALAMNGEMVDLAHVGMAQRILAKAEQVAARSAQGAPAATGGTEEPA